MRSNTHPRIEGHAKVTGRAAYVDDIRGDAVSGGFDVAMPVCAPFASAKAVVDAAEALRVPGVLRVMTAADAPRMRKVFAASMAEIGQRLPLQSPEVGYHGECVALVIADGLMAAQEGARLVRVARKGGGPTAHVLEDADDRLAAVKRAGIAAGRMRKGDALGVLDAADVSTDASFHTAPHHHNAMEPSAVIARWDEDGVTVHAATQWHHIETAAIGQAFGLGIGDGMAGLLGRMMLGR